MGIKTIDDSDIKQQYALSLRMRLLFARMDRISSLIGIEHFYLYNNNSTDNYEEVLKPYIDKGLVTLIDWPQEHSQRQAYHNAWESFKQECNWICFWMLMSLFV